MSTVPGCGHCDRPIPDGYPLCTRCTDVLAAQLRGVPDLIDDLLITLAKQDQLSTGAGRGRNEQPLPLRWDIPDDIWVLGNVVTTWARHLAETAGLRVDTRPMWRPRFGYDPARNGSPTTNGDRCAVSELPREMCAHCRGDQLVEGARPDGHLTTLHQPVPVLLGYRPPSALDSLRFAAGWLASNVEHLRRSVVACQAHDELNDAIKQANTACSAPPLRVFVGPCKSCEADLYGWPDHRAVNCLRCDTTYTDMAERWDLALFRLRGYPATAATIARFAGELYGVQLNRKLINSWYHRNKLTRVDDDPDSGDPRFRIGEVLDHARKSIPRTTAPGETPLVALRTTIV